jgi:ubiquinone/menaquinone biosynthesis C-methylase UbiE
VFRLNQLLKFGKRAQPSNMAADLQNEIRRSFNDAARDEEHFPSTIDPRIYHVKLLSEFLGGIDLRRVLDAGCGKGRFARILKQNHPAVSVCCMDIAEAMLRVVPEGLERTAGSLIALPYADAAFDAAYAIESLEHAVDIQAAVGELCRVVRPGGRVFIIDKNAEQWGRLETPPWEKWFHRRELEKLLRRHCTQVSSRFISYWEDVAPDGLFLAWLAIK